MIRLSYRELRRLAFGVLWARDERRMAREHHLTRVRRWRLPWS